MRIASLVAVSFLTLWPGYAASTLSGMWVLNPEKSELGRSSVPGQIIVRSEQSGRRLTIWRITTDSWGQHLTWRKYVLDRRSAPSNEVVRSIPGGIVLRIDSAPGMKTDEEWRVMPNGDLVIMRVVTKGFETLRERLVLEPVAHVAEMGTGQ